MAVHCTLNNLALNALQADIRKGDVYGPIGVNETFDYIFWNHPFNNWHEKPEDMLLRAGFDYHYEGLRKYISQAKQHLNSNGKLLLGTGNFADSDCIERIANENSYKISIIAQTTLPLRKDERNEFENKYLILEFVRSP